MVPMLHPDPGPRLLTPREAETITRQCIRVVYPDDETPVRTDAAEHISH